MFVVGFILGMVAGVAILHFLGYRLVRKNEDGSFDVVE